MNDNETVGRTNCFCCGSEKYSKEIGSSNQGKSQCINVEKEESADEVNYD